MTKMTKAACALLATIALPACAGGEPSTEDFSGASEGRAAPVAEAQQAISACVDIQRGLNGTVEDAYLSPSSPNLNSGTYFILYSGLSSGEEKRSVLKFDLASIPAGSTIDSATLKLSQVYKASGSTVNVHRVTSPWTEGNATWNTVGNAFDPAVAGTINASSGTGVRTSDVTGLVQGWVSGSYANDGLLIEETPVVKTEFRSSENTTAANRPMLTVCYTTPTCDDGVQNQGETGVDCGGPCAPCGGGGVMITGPGEAYGHHGQCQGWNGCGDAATCALWACQINGYSSLVSYGAEGPCTQFNNCHLFFSQGNIEWNWGNWCDVSGVSEVVCSN